MDHLHCSTKRVLLVAFFVLCFVSPHVQGRGLRVLMSEKRAVLVAESEKHKVEVLVTESKEQKKVETEVVHHPKEAQLPDSDELAGMDYTAMSNKPPVHN